MKSKGFTLLEILLTMGIIGIIASIMLRLMPNIMPDVNKAQFLRALTATKIVVQDMINATALYPDDYGSDTYGFKNTTMPLYGEYADDEFSGQAKFPLIFADRFGEDATESGGEYSFYSMRDNLTYKIKGDNNGNYTIKFYNKDSENIGGVEVTYDGETKCLAGVKDYCSGDLTNLRRE